MNRIGIKIDLDTGELVSSAGRARQSIAGLTEEMKKAQKEGRWDDYSKLAFDKDRLQGRTSGFERDIRTLTNDPRFQTQTSSGGTVFKIDSEYASLIKNQTDAIKKLTEEYEEAIRNGDVGKISELTPQIEQKQNEFHKITEQATAPQGGGAQAAKALASAFSVDRIVSAITSGVSTAVGYANKAGIVNRMGSGDVVGAEIEETRKEGELVGGIGKAALSIVGGAIGTLIAPGVGTAAGAVVGGGIGDLIKSLGFDLGANVRETEDARAKQWERQAPVSVELNAVLGKMGGSMDENTRNLRTSFDRASQAANEFGFSAEEGIETIKQAAMQGLNEDEAIAATRNIYDFERGTGADRGILTTVKTQFARYGEEDALGEAWRGNQASGMETGQYAEFLRSMQRVFEDGISKGFVRGAREISENLAFLADLNGGSELWKGDQGANRLSQMNSSIEQATSLSSTTDILAYRGAQNVIKDFTNDDWKKFLNVDNDTERTADVIRGRGGSDYINGMMLLEKGLTPQLFGEQMKMFNTSEMGDYAGIVERMRQAYGLNYTQSAQLYKSWDDHKTDPNYFKSETFSKELEKYNAAAPDHSSNEEAMFKNVETIKTKVVEIGMYFHDKKLPETEASKRRMTEELSGVPTGIIPAEDPESDPGTILDPGTNTNFPAEPTKEAVWAQSTPARQDQLIRQGGEEGIFYQDLKRQEDHAYDTVRGTVGKMYDEWFGSREDKTAYKNVNTIFESAMRSENPEDRSSAVRFSGMLESLPKETLDKYNKDNTWNQLGETMNIHGLETLLRELIETTRENGNVKVTVGG